MERGFFVKVAVNHEVVQLLSDDGACADHFGGSEDTFDGCMYDQLRRIGLEEVGCTVPWLPDKSSICQEEQDRKRAFKLYQKNRRNQVCPRHHQNLALLKKTGFSFVIFFPPYTRTTSVQTAACSPTCTSVRR